MAVGWGRRYREDDIREPHGASPHVGTTRRRRVVSPTDMRRLVLHELLIELLGDERRATLMAQLPLADRNHNGPTRRRLPARRRLAAAVAAALAVVATVAIPSTVAAQSDDVSDDVFRRGADRGSQADEREDRVRPSAAHGAGRLGRAHSASTQAVTATAGRYSPGRGSSRRRRRSAAGWRAHRSR